MLILIITNMFDMGELFTVLLYLSNNLANIKFLGETHG